MRVNFPSRYVKTGSIISGGMGNVILCCDKNLERPVAIKVVAGSDYTARVQDEIEALQKIRSKHVVQIFDIFIDGSGDDRCIGIVEEYLPGNELTVIAGNNFSEEEYLKILFQISCGISDIHEYGLIHRDIKPANMKFDQENLIKIFDFGLTRSQENNASTLGFRGTLGFAAPELYANGLVNFTKAVDTYAFGVTAWYLKDRELTQELKVRPPHPNVRKFSTLGGIPDKVAEILDATLDENPGRRPEMSDVRDTIARHLLYGKHQALIVGGTEVYNLRRIGQEVELNYSEIGSIVIRYTGLNFIISHISGNAFINNMPVSQGFMLPGSCVITLGGRELASRRKFITFDISHPEVVL